MSSEDFGVVGGGAGGGAPLYTYALLASFDSIIFPVRQEIKERRSFNDLFQGSPHF